jgi:hypothetical protein
MVRTRINRFFRWMALLCVLPATQADAQSRNQDYFGPLISWVQASGLEVTPIHVGLLPNGNLFFVNNYNFFENPGMNLTTPGFEPEYMFVMEPTPLSSPPPPFVLIKPLASPSPFNPLLNEQARTIRFKSLACSGHSLMADGNLFFASGSDAVVDLNLYSSGQLSASLKVDGIAESLTYNPFTGAWKNNPNTVAPGPVTGKPLRWYATVTRLADSRMLVTGGYEKVFPLLSYNTSVEVLDPASNSWSTVSGVHDTPEGIENPDYTHVFQIPFDGKDSATGAGSNTVLMIGGSAEPLFLSMNGKDKSWRRTQKYRPGAKEHMDAAASAKHGDVPNKVVPNYGSSSALLPIRLPRDGWGYANGSVINVGGDHDTPMEGHIDVYDPGADAWRPSIEMHGLRHHPSTVILPDGRILILAGHDDESAVKQTGFAEYVDPRNNFALTQGAAQMPETRGYHTVTVLLPDGRVLVGGGNVDGRDAVERTDFRYYFPDYMFKERPRIAYTQETIRIAEYFFVHVPHKTRISEAALMGLGSMTHSFDMSQRHVQLRLFNPKIIKCVDGEHDCYDLYMIQAPTSKEMAPPGYYMLFILDESRVPSQGKIMKLE